MADLSEADELRHRQELEAFLIKKAWRDAKFKEALLASPRTTLQQELQTLSPGVQIPDGVEVVVHEESMTKIHLVLPVNPVATELKDGELDLVAGGWGCGEKMCGCMYRSDIPRQPSPCADKDIIVAPTVRVG